MAKSLSQYAKENQQSYSKAWREFQSGQLNGAFKSGGRIYVEDTKSNNNESGPIKISRDSYKEKQGSLKLNEVYAASRRNRSATEDLEDKFKSIEDGITPFRHHPSYLVSSDHDVHDAIRLTQKAYYNFAPLRNVIELMTEFAISNIYFRNGSKSSIKFFEAYFKKIGLNTLQEYFYRELFRSGNIFMHKWKGTFRREDLKKITKLFGIEEVQAQEKEVTVPLRYSLLNPADIQFEAGLDFQKPFFYKRLNSYELERLRNPRTDEDQQIFDNLSPELQEEIKDSRSNQVRIPLEPSNLTAVFYQKQPYEPMAIPFAYPVLEDINFKKEMKKMDMAATRSINYWILLIKMGTEDGDVDQNNIKAMKDLFDNEAIGKVLVSDGTTQAQFITPDFSDFLDPKKYDVVERDINMGLNNILAQNERFANQSIRVKVFIERLKKAQQKFKEEFLIPEMREIAKQMNFKSIPTPHFDDIQFRDEAAVQRIYSRLLELGILTPEEGFDALETGRLPSKQESVERQEQYVEERSRGLYTPLSGGAQPFFAKDQDDGRPPGTRQDENDDSNNRSMQIESNFSLDKLKDNMIKADKVQKKVRSKLKEKHGIDKLNEQQEEIANEVAQSVMSNRKPQNWLKCIDSFIKKPKQDNKERLTEIDEIAANYGVNTYLASLLVDSKVDG